MGVLGVLERFMRLSSKSTPPLQRARDTNHSVDPVTCHDGVERYQGGAAFGSWSGWAGLPLGDREDLFTGRRVLTDSGPPTGVDSGACGGLS